MLKRTGPISTLLWPNSVALVGASDDVTRIGGRPLRYLRESGFAGSIYPVNPKRETVQGVKAFSSVAALPEAPDVAILAVPAAATVQAVRECAERGVKAAIVFSAGFAETDAAGRAMQDEMVGIARDSGMRLLGPNCLGVFNSSIGFYGTFSAMLDSGLVTPGSIGIVSQSGAYGSHLMYLARLRGLGMSYMITTGNECDIDVSEALRWMVEQPDINVVMAYAEGVRDRDTFIQALEIARERRKAIVFMKVGRSAVGAHAVSSHTAALAGSDAIFDAVFRQYGVWRASTTAEQIDIAAACSRGVYPKNNSLGIFTMSGGFGIQMADDAEAAGLDVKPMPEKAQEELKAMLPYASPRNPVDATAQAVTDLPLMTNFISAMLEKGDFGFFAGIFGSGPASPTFSGKLRQALEVAAASSRDTIMALTMTAPDEIVRAYEKEAFIVAQDGSALMKTLGAMVHFKESFERAGRAPATIPLPEPVDLGTEPLSELAAKQIFGAAGVPFTADRLVVPGGDIRAAADAVGYPQVLKIVSADIAHKTEIGGVIVGVKDAEEAEQAFATILSRAQEKRPDARVDGVMVAPMISGGVETIVGVVSDPVFGPVVMFGLGGVFVEVLKDVTFRVAPFDVDEAHRMIREIRGFAMLEGVRGAPPSDVDALAEMLAALSRFAAANAAGIDSIDLNPVRVMERGKGVMALDALVVPRGAKVESH
ncbi:MAG: acetate--CoA ligase family protein [Mesorhizobium sp.]|nr:acetate--CoA ligase family protein [Mesorhizobium sp.]MCO5162072.1 acetate--CoA ligase family protein [Mesorhizobium sp.]